MIAVYEASFEAERKKKTGLSQEPVFKSFYFHESTISNVDLF